MATDTEPAVNETANANANAPAPAPDRDADRLAEAQRFNAEIVRLCAEHAAKSREEKAAKKVMEAARHRLNDYLAGLDDEAEAKPMPPFGHPAAAPKPVGADGWRSVPVGILAGKHRLSRKLVAALAEAGLGTLGRLADWTAGGHALTEIDGVGDRGAERIADALTGYWGSSQAADNDPGPANGEADRKIADWLDRAEAEARDAAGRAATSGEGVPDA